MLGSREPFTLSQSGYEKRRGDPRFRELFDWDIDVLRNSYVGGPVELERWVGEGPIITDDKPLIEYFLALPDDDPPVDLSALRGRFEDVLRP